LKGQGKGWLGGGGVLPAVSPPHTQTFISQFTAVQLSLMISSLSSEYGGTIEHMSSRTFVPEVEFRDGSEVRKRWVTLFVNVFVHSHIPIYVSF
jgi:hypothetical protein